MVVHQQIQRLLWAQLHSVSANRRATNEITLQRITSLPAHLIIVTNCDMVISWGTKNLVLSKGFKDFSLLYRSTIICEKFIFRIKKYYYGEGFYLTGILVGNLFLIAATSSFRSAETHKKLSLENFSHKLH
jgi:hypothetical protein